MLKTRLNVSAVITAIWEKMRERGFFFLSLLFMFLLFLRREDGCIVAGCLIAAQLRLFRIILHMLIIAHLTDFLSPPLMTIVVSFLWSPPFSLFIVCFTVC